jgi:very-short-patch-repair endonuclease
MTRFDHTPEKMHRARRLRREATPAERILWSGLRGAQLGTSFRRQHPVGPYILDFYSPSLRLAVELDGDQHGRALGRERDARRDAWLGGKGIRVLRFWNSDVRGNLRGVLDDIWRHCVDAAATPTRSAAPTDLPLSGGGNPNLPSPDRN